MKASLLDPKDLMLQPVQFRFRQRPPQSGIVTAISPSGRIANVTTPDNQHWAIDTSLLTLIPKPSFTSPPAAPTDEPKDSYFIIFLMGLAAASIGIAIMLSL